MQDKASTPARPSGASNGTGAAGAAGAGALAEAVEARLRVATGVALGHEETESPGAPGAVRERLALALDFDDSVVAMRWATRLRGYFAVAKVGLELFSAAGPAVVAELVEAGFKVFVDLKMADIPNTTRKAARVLGSLGVSYLTVHTSAGEATLRAGVEGLAAGAERAGLADPVALGVTVLTSEDHAPAELLRARLELAQLAGCGGYVCGGPDLAEARAAVPGLLAVVPGLRLAGDAAHDHGRTSTPGQAARSGAGLLVIGRAVTQAAVPEEAAQAVVADVEQALAELAGN